jgi:methionine synthase I (cobalamin-dependent)
MHTTIETLLSEHKKIITDGAWGTQLQIKGLKKGECPDAMNLVRPEMVEAVASDYVNAGSRIILTNTFGANRFVLSRYGYQDQVEEINAAGVEISKKATDGNALVFGSIGPTGQLLMNDGKLKEEMQESFDKQSDAMLHAGADGIVIETMSNMNEAVLAIQAAKRTGLPVVACAVFDSGRDKDRTMMGDPVEKVVETFTVAGVDVIGSNCGQGIAGFLPICKRMRSMTSLPIWMKPNAGLPLFEDGKITYAADPEGFADMALKLAELGADFLGGCCGTSPDFVRTLIARLSS